LPETVLSRRALNRATLARQLLIDRAALKVPAALERIGGIQAQLARPPFLGLWSRLRGFRREDLARAAASGAVVRATLYRGTIHLVSRADFLAFRPVIHASLVKGGLSIIGDRLERTDLDAVMAAARRYFDQTPRTFDDARKHLAREFPRDDQRAMGYYVRMNLPLLQVPEAGAAWAWPAQAGFTLADTWLKAPLKKSARADALALRYLGAFGPASGADFQAWSGVRAAQVLETLRPQLRTFRTEEGRELFDLPRAPRPDADQPVPVRFLAPFDSLLLAYADRSRTVPEVCRRALTSKNLMVPGTFLVDGMVAGTWDLTVTKKKVTVGLTALTTVARGQREALAAEGEALARFVDPEATSAVTFAGTR
jgi:hypothetical protein